MSTIHTVSACVSKHYRPSCSRREHNALLFLFQIPCATLHEVIDALVEKTAGTLQPFLLEEPYEENISEAAHAYSQHLFSSFPYCCYKSSIRWPNLHSVCHQHTFPPMMKTEKGSSTPPPPALFPGLLPYLRNRVCLCHTHRHTHRQTII